MSQAQPALPQAPTGTASILWPPAPSVCPGWGAAGTPAATSGGTQRGDRSPRCPAAPCNESAGLQARAVASCSGALARVGVGVGAGGLPNISWCSSGPLSWGGLCYATQHAALLPVALAAEVPARPAASPLPVLPGSPGAGGLWDLGTRGGAWLPRPPPSVCGLGLEGVRARGETFLDGGRRGGVSSTAPRCQGRRGGAERVGLGRWAGSTGPRGCFGGALCPGRSPLSAPGDGGAGAACTWSWVVAPWPRSAPAPVPPRLGLGARRCLEGKGGWGQVLK